MFLFLSQFIDRSIYKQIEDKIKEHEYFIKHLYIPFHYMIEGKKAYL